MTAIHAIEIEGLGYSYQDTLVLSNVAFNVGSGEVFGLLGPNGSGKTTLFGILSTLLTPTLGSGRIYGVDIRRNPGAVRRLIGVVFQSSSVDSKLTVAENLRHQGHLYGLRGNLLRHRIGESLRHVGLSERSRDRVETLSGGLRRRLEIAKSFLHWPRLLILDEPSAGLDPGARRDLWATLGMMKHQSALECSSLTILVTTHLMDEAEQCDRLALLDQGQLVAVDTPAKLKTRMGGDAIHIQCRNPERIREALEARFGCPSVVLGDTVRIQRERGHAFVTEIVEAFPGMITAVTVRQPTLEDVFFHLTGHQFDDSSSLDLLREN